MWTAIRFWLIRTLKKLLGGNASSRHLSVEAQQQINKLAGRVSVLEYRLGRLEENNIDCGEFSDDKTA